MSSSLPIAPVQSPRRALSIRQAETVQRLTDAANVEVKTVGFDAMTVRSVAKRAGVAPATAYTYFASKEHLVTEAFWRLLSALPDPTVDPRRAIATRILQALSDMSGLFVEMPELVSACTVAMVSDDPDVKQLRDRVGHEIHRRFVAALGADARSDVLEALDLAMSGALLRAGTGHMSHADVPQTMADVATLLLGKRR